MKHGEHILAFRNDALVSLGLKEGFNPISKSKWDVISMQLNGATEIRRRKELESDLSMKQMLPYLLFYRIDAEGTVRYFTYQRGKGIGEDRLLGNASIGVGGHVEVEDLVTVNSILDINLVLQRNALRETLEELKIFRVDLDEEDYETFEDSIAARIADHGQAIGLLFDHSNDVGQYHLGIVYAIDLGENLYAEIKEKELKFLGWNTHTELTQLPVTFESWSKLVIDNLMVTKEVDVNLVGAINEVIGTHEATVSMQVGRSFNFTAGEQSTNQATDPLKLEIDIPLTDQYIDLIARVRLAWPGVLIDTDMIQFDDIKLTGDVDPFTVVRVQSVLPGNIAFWITSKDSFGIQYALGSYKVQTGEFNIMIDDLYKDQFITEAGEPKGSIKLALTVIA